MSLDHLRSFFRKSIVKDAASLSLGRAANLLLGFVSMLIYGVVFQKRQIAVISLFEMLVNLVLSFGISWSTLGIIRFGKEEYLEKGRLNYTSTLRLALVLPVVIFSILLLVFFAQATRKYIGTDDTGIVGFLIASILLTAFHEHISVLFTAVERHVCNAVFYLLESIAKIIILIIFYVGVISINAERYIQYSVYASLIIALIRVLYTKKSYILPIVKCNIIEIKHYFSFVFPQAYGFAALYVINWIDVYFINMYCNLDELGAYQFVYSLFIKIASFAFIINNLCFPKIVAWKTSQGSVLVRYINKVPYYMYLITFSIMLCACISYKPVFAVVFDNKYVSAYLSFDLLLLNIPFQYATYILLPILNAYDKVMYVQLINIVVAMVNVIVDWVLIQRIGIVGAAVGTFAAYALKLYLIIAFINKMFFVKQNALIVTTVISLCIVIGYALTSGYIHR
jgi:O-antigen/teichoic acid export membrane protein